MKFLCLHGAGTSSEVLEIQLGPVRDALKAHVDFEYYDGFLEVDTVEEIKNVFKGPFFTWYSPGLGGKTLVEAKAELLDLIESDGPFDACLGFSQGAGLLAAVIMDYQKTHPFSPNLFRLAIFICAAAPVLVVKSEEDAGFDYRPSAESMAHLTEAWKGPYVPGHEPRPNEEWNIFIAEKVRKAGLAIRIPTAHIYGSNDEGVSESLRLRDMCDERRRVEFDHGRGHEVPRAPKLVSQMAETINRAITNALTAV
ncbi:serine hydrolase FSH [Talaromyces proteolyticus]|uniref:Serine hydrolase FSH n=1 Tax=Talaromyces proteolyticus TaxID=1131652 RepID=A0AAD4KUE3_9EURO|nr:serine hydrolase FSH [Talaromyces proteolyticus]KAH8701067.1 serine hydrolase FSH [Talaromyces proteolyticus]